MLFQDWDIEISGKHIFIGPMKEQDEESYGRLMFGNSYERFVELLDGVSPTGIRKILNHTATDETHALRLLGCEPFIGWITLQKDEKGKPDIGISLVPECQNKGYGPEAVTLFANRLFEAYGVSTVYVHIFESNIQSQKAFSKIGAILDYAAPHKQMGDIDSRLRDGMLSQAAVPTVLYYHIDLPIRLLGSK